jgi:glycosyltransferase involved in cell wall biosynthesis
MRLVYVGTLPPHPGGSAISCSQLLVAFAERGHEIVAVGPITPAALASGDAFAARHPGVRVRRFPVPYFETAPNTPAADGYRRAQRDEIQAALSAVLAEDRPDLILIGRETFAWDIPQIARAHAVPCILRAAGSMTIGVFSGAFPDHLVADFLQQCRQMDAIVAPAQHLAGRMRALGVSHIRVIPNGVDLERFTPRPRDSELMRELGIASDAVVVAHVSNLKALKRPLDVIESAVRALRRHGPLRYVVVGDGPARVVMQAACERHGIAERVRFVGWVEYERMPAYINLADIVVMPSEDEAQARVYLETQACARLVLASDISGAREVIADGRTGLLFRKGDIEDLTEKTLFAAENREERLAIGRRARESAAGHSLDGAVRAYLAMFADVGRSQGYLQSARVPTR